MIYQIFLHFLTLILDLVDADVAANEKGLEIALLRQQFRALERKSKHLTRLTPPEKLMLVALADKLKTKSERFRVS